MCLLENEPMKLMGMMMVVSRAIIIMALGGVDDSNKIVISGDE